MWNWGPLTHVSETPHRRHGQSMSSSSKSHGPKLAVCLSPVLNCVILIHGYNRNVTCKKKNTTPANRPIHFGFIPSMQTGDTDPTEAGHFNRTIDVSHVTPDPQFDSYMHKSGTTPQNPGHGHKSNEYGHMTSVINMFTGFWRIMQWRIFCIVHIIVGASDCVWKLNTSASFQICTETYSRITRKLYLRYSR